jgi:hypothetical protein
MINCKDCPWGDASNGGFDDYNQGGQSTRFVSAPPLSETRWPAAAILQGTEIEAPPEQFGA